MPSKATRRPLSIAMLAPCPFPTHQGTQVLIRHLAEMLSRAGHQIHLITFGYGEYEAELPFYVHRAPKVDAGLRSGPSLWRTAADAALVMTASRVIKAHRCDLLHVHNVEGLGLGALLKLQTSLPVVYHAHTAMGPELPTYFRAQLAQAFASVIGDVIDRTLPRAADAVITFDADHKALHEVYGIPAKRVHVVPPGMSSAELCAPQPEVLDRVRARIGQGPFVLYAGNPDRYQNLELLLAAFALARAQRPELRLLIATNYAPSEFTTAYGESLEQPGVVIDRYRDIEELRALLALSTLGASPRSLWAGVPVKLLNYLAAGLPTVACRASARHLLPESAGRLVDENPESFAAGIVALLDERIDRNRVRKAFRRFEIEEQLGDYEAVYAQVLRKHSGKGAEAHS